MVLEGEKVNALEASLVTSEHHIQVHSTEILK